MCMPTEKIHVADAVHFESMSGAPVNFPVRLKSALGKLWKLHRRVFIVRIERGDGFNWVCCACKYLIYESTDCAR
jgi:hypothetical protein